MASYAAYIRVTIWRGGHLLVVVRYLPESRGFNTGRFLKKNLRLI